MRGTRGTANWGDSSEWHRVLLPVGMLSAAGQPTHNERAHSPPPGCLLPSSKRVVDLATGTAGPQARAVAAGEQVVRAGASEDGRYHVTAPGQRRRCGDCVRGSVLQRQQQQPPGGAAASDRASFQRDACLRSVLQEFRHEGFSQGRHFSSFSSNQNSHLSQTWVKIMKFAPNLAQIDVWLKLGPSWSLAQTWVFETCHT